jgi:NADH-quinone oxidoreductase subunit I/electron transport complex protein RnfC
MSEIQRGKVITVERGRRTGRMPGAALLDGMAVVWRHWQGSFRKNRSFEQIHGTFTVEYPEERVRLPEAYRNMPILLYDEESGHELCTSCFQCQRICPPQVIHMTQAKDPDTGKAVPALAEFIIEYDACMSCGFCAEICPFDAIKMDHDFELATDDHPALTVSREQLNRPTGYYESIAPTQWAEVRAQALKKLQGNIKRRPDVLGMAPNLADRLVARRAQLRAEREAAVASAPAAAPAPAAPAASPQADKAAKLAAIRARNAAKAAGLGELAEPAPPAAPPAPAEAPPEDEKAARLAAIRARNAAKAAEQAPSAEPEAQAPPVAPPAPAEAPPEDEKAARLAAIRARNAARKAAEEGQGGEG